MADFVVNIAEGAETKVVTAVKNMINAVEGFVTNDVVPVLENTEQTVETAAAAAWVSVEASFAADLPVLEGQALGLLSAFLTGGEAALAALLPVDAGIDVVADKTALPKAVRALAWPFNL